MSDLSKIYPSNSERFNFIKGLVRIARADSVISPEEEVFFVNASTTLGLEQEQIVMLKHALNNIDEKTNLSVSFPQKSQSIFLIKEAIQLCHIDGKYSTNERKEVQLLAKELSIEEDAIRSLEQWVEEGIAWTRRGDLLLTQLSE